MNIQQLVEHYGDQAAAADAIRVSRQAVSKWKKAGRIPLEYQLQWEENSAGAVRADLPAFVRRNGKARVPA